MMRAAVLAVILSLGIAVAAGFGLHDVTLDVALQTRDEEVYLTLDGQVGFPFRADDRLRVDHHPHAVRLVRVTGVGFFEILRRKLRWGER